MALSFIWVPDIPIDRVEQKFCEHLNDKLLPITFVAFDGSKVVGGAFLRENDGIQPQLKPWLGSLVHEFPT